MSLETLNTPTRGDPILARDQRRLYDQVKENSQRIAVFEEAGARFAPISLFEVTDLPNPGVIVAKLWGDPAPTPVEYIIACDVTYSETSRETVTYFYTSFNVRTAQKTGEPDEQQFLTPSLLVGDPVVATAIGGADGWYAIDLAGRQWAAGLVQSP